MLPAEPWLSIETMRQLIRQYDRFEEAEPDVAWLSTIERADEFFFRSTPRVIAEQRNDDLWLTADITAAKFK